MKNVTEKVRLTIFNNLSQYLNTEHMLNSMNRKTYDNIRRNTWIFIEPSELRVSRMEQVL